jgi:hypothetical protein
MVGVRGRRRRYGCEDRVPNTFGIFQHFIIPETEYSIAMIGKPLVAENIALAGGMLATVNFDDESLLPADEIDNVRADRYLADKFKIVQPARTQVLP